LPAFIETQFPIARLSAEAYKERKANLGQTLTRLGKWWGRKPLILVRAAILGMVMPASGDPKKDREIFLKILTMDDDGAWQRCKGDIPAAAWRDAAPPGLRVEYFGARGFKQGIGDEEKADLCHRIWDSLTLEEQTELDAKRRRPVPDRADFDALPYADRIRHCERPENIEGPNPAAWADINAHLGTTARSLPELVEQLGQRTFGHTPRVGDAFCGGGSIPFEAARIGCEAFGSDLNPVAGLLTWASLNLLGGGADVQKAVMRVQGEALAAADRQITEWGIEHNDRGERADAYLYCVEVKPEGSEYYIPLAPSWLIGERSKVVCRWRRVPGSDRLEPDIAVVGDAELKRYKDGQDATVVDSRVVDPFEANRSWSVEALRGPEGLRRWTNDDLVPRPGDAFQERLYCIRWVKTVMVKGKPKELRRYAAPDAADLAREATVLALLRERFAAWQREGYIPSRTIPESGAETDRLFRERGWTHWHHLFTPRQLLTHGLLAERAEQLAESRAARVGCLLGLGRMADWNSRLSAWMFHVGNEKGNQVFYNQALNCHFSYSSRPFPKLKDTFTIFGGDCNDPLHFSDSEIRSLDSRDLDETCDLWVTDPPYADAVNYHELADFFLAWYEKPLARIFPEWLPDARAELAVRGDGGDFRRSMVDIYRNLARHMPDTGLQMVMFTHKNPAVWADLGMILWAAGLKATAAWTISTETDAVGIKKGDYVQGTVCLVLRKRAGAEPGFLDEVYPLVEDEVKRQIASMQALDEDGEPNFNDADYQLAAYAAALKVLTQYATLDGRDVEHEVFAVRDRSQKSDFQIVIERALGIACDTLIPRGLDTGWRDLSLVERYYLRALDIESRGERRKGMYEELARGFGVTDIRPLLKSDKANGARMHTASGLAATQLAQPDGTAADSASLPARRGRAASGGPHPFAAAPLRHVLFAIRETVAADNSPEPGRQYLRDTFGQGYWGRREGFVYLLDWLAALGNAESMDEWAEDSEAARILAGRLRNDHG
jgi:adenine-specific DNA methylase